MFYNIDAKLLIHIHNIHFCKITLYLRHLQECMQKCMIFTTYILQSLTNLTLQLLILTLNAKLKN